MGNRWFFNIETRLLREDGRITLQKPDMHLEQFCLSDGAWVNERNGDETIRLTEEEDGYLAFFVPSGKTYAYDREGRLTECTDACGNRTVLTYEGGVLKRLALAGGQFLDFTFQEGRLASVRDAIGRKITYRYEDALLTSVVLPNGGEIGYEYTNRGYLRQVTDPNGSAYVTMEYDFKGRVTRQKLATGEEYILYYDDKKKENTTVSLVNGERVVYTYGRERIPLREIYADGTYREKRYDAWENCIYERDCNGEETHRTYDVHGNLRSERLPDGTETHYTYDASGRRTGKTDSLGGEEQWTYDKRGCLIRYARRVEGETYAVTSYTRDLMLVYKCGHEKSNNL